MKKLTAAVVVVLVSVAALGTVGAAQKKLGEIFGLIRVVEKETPPSCEDQLSELRATIANQTQEIAELTCQLSCSRDDDVCLSSCLTSTTEASEARSRIIRALGGRL